MLPLTDDGNVKIVFVSKYILKTHNIGLFLKETEKR